MKLVIVRPLVASLLLYLLGWCVLAADPNLKQGLYLNEVEALRAYSKQLASTDAAAFALLFELAHERYVANTNANRRLLMTVRPGTTFRSYTDGQHTIIAVPYYEDNPFQRDALANYCAGYNVWVEAEFISKVKSGQYDGAKELYRLLIHFAPDRLKKEHYEKVLECIEKLERGEDTTKAMKLYDELVPGAGSQIDFTQIDKLKPIQVKSLLALPETVIP